MKLFHYGLMACLLVSAPSLQGCAAKETKEAPIDETGSKETDDFKPKAPVVSDGKDAAAVTVETLDWDKTLEQVKKYPGKVVVMDVWATYCPPCVDEFPHLVKLHQEHGDQVATISVSADFDGTTGTTVETNRDKVLEFLTKQKAQFQNILLSTDTETLFSEKIKHQSIPIVLIFDREGKLVKEFPDPKNPDEFTYTEHVIPFVKSLLNP